jgi:hypothetical protein
VKGDAGTPSFSSPSGWECDFGLDRGNFYGFFSVVKETDDPDAKPYEGKACLKAGYYPSPNKIMPVPTQYSPAFDKAWKPFDGKALVPKGAPANFFSTVQSGRSPLKTGKTYIFSMRVRGSKVNEGNVVILYDGYKKLSEEKIERGTRGAATVKKNEARQNKTESIPFNPGTQWSEVRKEFTVKFEDKDLSDLAQVTNWSTNIVFTLSPGKDGGFVFFDDVKIIEK